MRKQPIQKHILLKHTIQTNYNTKTIHNTKNTHTRLNTHNTKPHMSKNTIRTQTILNNKQYI